MVMLVCRSPYLVPSGRLAMPCTSRPDRMILGVVAFRTHKGEPAEAILDAEGRWRCPELPVLDRVLNALHEPSRNPAGDASFGHPELIRVAAWLKGEAQLRRP